MQEKNTIKIFPPSIMEDFGLSKESLISDSSKPFKPSTQKDFDNLFQILKAPIKE